MVDQRERADDLFEALRSMLDGREASVWQGGPGIVQSFDGDAMTCVVQPAIQARVSAKDGTVSLVDMPLLLDVPVFFPSGGGCTLTFGVSAGDECYFAIADRCIDGWWQSGGIQAPMEARMHDLSDAFAFVGVFSQPRVLPSISTTKAQLRSNDGQAYLELDPSAHTVNIAAPGGSTINADVTIEGALHVSGKITSDTDVVTGSISLKNHKHGGVQTGGGVSGVPQ